MNINQNLKVVNCDLILSLKWHKFNQECIKSAAQERNFFTLCDVVATI